MEKVINFTEEQKSLIWATKCAPQGATPDETKAFVQVCEEYGLNPLQGDIIFQAFEGKYGRRVSYIVTRDGLLKHAYRQNDFISINAGVVHKNDVFEFDTNNEIVHHKFGTERGEIIGAWCVLKTKSRGNIMEFANYHEYKNALVGKNDLWSKMPSSMIKKTAQSNAIKLAFPLGVIFATEDEVVTIEESNGVITSSQPAETKVSEDGSATKTAQPSLADELKAEAEKTEKTKQQRKSTKEAKSSSVEKKEVAKVEEQPKEEKVEVQKNKEEVTTEVQAEPVQNVEQQSTNVEEPVQTVKTVPAAQVQNQQGNVYKFIDSQIRVDANEQKFLIVLAESNGSQEHLFANGEVLEKFDEFTNGIQFTAQLQEANGFKFVKDVAVVSA